MKLSAGEIILWMEQESSIQLKAITAHGDPVELNATEARQLAQELLRLAALVDLPVRDERKAPRNGTC